MNGDKGFTYFFVFIMLIFMGIAMGMTGKMWSKMSQTEREQELLFRGDQIKKAIEMYYTTGHGGNFYPKNLSDLIKDPRSLTPKRYLRKPYKDPITQDGEWELILDPQGRIKGVKSKSEKKPLKQKNFPDDYKHFEGKEMYKEWEFVYTPKRGATVPPTRVTPPGTNPPMINPPGINPPPRTNPPLIGGK